MTFKRHTVDDGILHPVSVQAIDVDGDGQLDVVTGSDYDAEIVWYRNEGLGASFGRRVVSTAATVVASVRGAVERQSTPCFMTNGKYIF